MPRFPEQHALQPLGEGLIGADELDRVLRSRRLRTPILPRRERLAVQRRAPAVRVLPAERVVEAAHGVVHGDGVPHGVGAADADVRREREAQRVRGRVALGGQARAEQRVGADLVRREGQRARPPVEERRGVLRVERARVVGEADVVGLHHDLAHFGD